MKKLLLISWLLLGVSTNTNAALMSTDWMTAGDNALTLDESTGLEWLDLTQTAGRNYNDIVGLDGSNELVAGGNFAGFRYATLIEVETLYLNHGFPSTNIIGQTNFNPIESALAQSFINLFGNTSGNILYSRGIYEASPSPGFHYYADVGFLFINTVARVQPGLTVSDSNNNILAGHFLVRSNSVPEPSTFALLSTGLIGFGFRKIRRKK